MTTTASEQKAFKDWPNDLALHNAIDEREPVELQVVGTFPPQVAGILYRNGPSQYRVTSEKGAYERSHWFDGFAQLHRFEIIRPEASALNDSCRVRYTSRGQVDSLIEEARRTGDLKYVTFGQKRDPCESIFQKAKCVFQPTAPSSNPQMFNVNVTVTANMPGMRGQAPSARKDAHIKVLSCLTDANQITHAHPDTLEPIGVTEQKMLHPDLKGPLSCAHPQYEPTTGDMYNYNLNFGPKATFRIFRTSAFTGKTDIIATISETGLPPTYIHSFFLTSDYIVLCAWPLYFKGNGAAVLWERNMVDALKFHSTAKTQWFVIDRKGSKGVVARYASPAFFAFHTINAFQEERDGDVDIICDIIQFPNADILHRTYLDNLLSTRRPSDAPETPAPDTVRYRLARISQARAAKAPPSAEILFKIRTGDLPTINPLFATKKTRYHYCPVNRGHSSMFDGIAKVDMETREVAYWGREPAPHTPGEAVFVPDGSGDAEDAGYILSVVLNGETGSSYLLCLDARTMQEIGRAECSHAISLGIHGAHYPVEGS